MAEHTYFSSWAWAEAHGIPDPRTRVHYSTGTVWYQGQPNIWGYWPTDHALCTASRQQQRVHTHLCIIEWPPLPTRHSQATDGIVWY